MRDGAQKELLLAYALVLALRAEGWRIAPEQFAALAAELKMAPGDVAARFRALGATCSARAVPGTGQPGYVVALLQQDASAGAARTLAQSFPPPKVGAKRQGR